MMSQCPSNYKQTLIQLVMYAPVCIQRYAGIVINHCHCFIYLQHSVNLTDTIRVSLHADNSCNNTAASYSGNDLLVSIRASGQHTAIMIVSQCSEPEWTVGHKLTDVSGRQILL